MKTKVRSLRTILLMTAILLFLITVSVFLFSDMAYDKAIYAYADHSFGMLGNSIDAQVDLAVYTLKKTAKTISYVTQIQNVLFTRTPSEYMRNTSGADQIINLLRDGDIYCDYIFLLSTNGRKCYVYEEAKDICQNKVAAYMKQGMLGKEPFFSEPFFYHSTGYRHLYSMYVLPVSNVCIDKGNFMPDAFCAVVCDLNHLLYTLRENSAQDSVVCLQTEGELLVSSRELSDEESELVASGSVGPSGTYYLHRIKHPELPFTLIFLTPYEAYAGNAPELRRMTMMLLMLEIGIMITLFTLLFASVIRPLRRLVSDVQAINHTEYVRVRPAKIQEFATLSDAINRMLAEIDEAYTNEQETRGQLYTALEEQTRAMLYAYRVQINPHFLFNALECIRALAQRHSIQEIEEQVSGLSRSYRYLLSADTIVSLSEELRSVEGYFNVVKPQINNDIELQICCAPEARTAKVLSLILQPLMENALLHGMASIERHGIVRIEVNITGDNRLFIRITDNGQGMSAEKIEQLTEECRGDTALKESEHIGLGNITRRMRLFFGPQFTFELHSSLGHYTSVTLYIPYENSKD